METTYNGAPTPRHPLRWYLCQGRQWLLHDQSVGQLNVQSTARLAKFAHEGRLPAKSGGTKVGCIPAYQVMLFDQVFNIKQISLAFKRCQSRTMCLTKCGLAYLGLAEESRLFSQLASARFGSLVVRIPIESPRKNPKNQDVPNWQAMSPPSLGKYVVHHC